MIRRMANWAFNRLNFWDSISFFHCCSIASFFFATAFWVSFENSRILLRSRSIGGKQTTLSGLIFNGWLFIFPLRLAGCYRPVESFGFFWVWLCSGEKKIPVEVWAVHGGRRRKRERDEVGAWIRRMMMEFWQRAVDTLCDLFFQFPAHFYLSRLSISGLSSHCNGLAVNEFDIFVTLQCWRFTGFEGRLWQDLSFR